MTRVQRAAEGIIAAACRRLPDDTRDDRCREWSAEIPAILQDPGTRPAVLRAARALGYALGIIRCARHPQFTGGGRRRSARGDLIVRVGTGLGIYLAVLGLILAAGLVFGHQHAAWLLLSVVPACLALDGFCLADLARARDVRYLPKWGWALVCLAQSPFGGIMYLSVGRVRS